MATEFRFGDGKSVKERLLALRERGNKPFTQGLHPGVENILGLRVPDVRALAKEIAQGDWPCYLKNPGDFFMEERMLHGLVLGQIKINDPSEYLHLVESFVGKINSWSVCDTFTFSGGQRFADANRAIAIPWLTAYLESEEEYEVRFGVTMLMRYYITGDNTDRFIDLMESIEHQGYYVRMAVAWAISVAFVKNPAAVMHRLINSRLDTWTLNKSIAKIIESRCVSLADKSAVRALRRHE